MKPTEVFLSHSSKDRRFANRIAEVLTRVCSLLLFAAFAAMLGPACRATCWDPVKALREE